MDRRRDQVLRRHLSHWRGPPSAQLKRRRLGRLLQMTVAVDRQIGRLDCYPDSQVAVLVGRFSRSLRRRQALALAVPPWLGRVRFVSGVLSPLCRAWVLLEEYERIEKHDQAQGSDP